LGEDVVQDAMVKATAALDRLAQIANLESWLFRIAHNVAVDFLRRRARADAGRTDEDPDMFADDERQVTDPAIVEASLATFMRLPAAQRSAVILMDVLGYRLQEISAIVDMSVPAVKSALHRGRAHLRELARSNYDGSRDWMLVPGLSRDDSQLSSLIRQMPQRPRPTSCSWIGMRIGSPGFATSDTHAMQWNPHGLNASRQSRR
jgi:RNA polymerase sigma factor (sigma-70 family)